MPYFGPSNKPNVLGPPITALTLFDHPSTKTAAYDRIWQEIHALEASIIVLKRQHNSLSVIARLPAEVLQEVFTWIGAFEEEEDPFARHSTILWLTQVCTYWRQLALSYAPLWNRVSHLHSTQFLDEVMPRTKNVPLNVYSTLFSASATQNLKTLLTHHLPRIENLGIVMPLGSSQDVLSILNTSTPAPILERFIVSVYGPGRLKVLPNKIFDGVIPRLHSLVLRGCSITVDSRLLTENLTSLELKDLPESPNPSISVYNVLLILAKLPNLQRFAMLDESNYNCSSNSDFYPQAQLPMLRELWLTVDPCGARLLANITFPSTTTVNLKAYSRLSLCKTDVAHGTLGHVATFLARHAEPVRCLSVEHRRNAPVDPTRVWTFIVKTWSTSGTPLCPPGGEPSSVIIVEHALDELESEGNWDQVYEERTEWDDTAWLKVLWGKFAFDQLESLHVEGAALEVAFWHAFGGLPVLKNVRVVAREDDVDVEQKFVLALAMDDIRFGALHSIVADGWHLFSSDGIDDHEIRRKKLGKDVFIVIIKKRKCLVGALESMYIVGFEGIHSQDVEELRLWINNVSWDMQE